MNTIEKTLVILDVIIFQSLIVFGFSSFDDRFDSLFYINILAVIGFRILSKIGLGTE